MTGEPARLVVARVRGLHGLRGVVRVEVLTDRPEDRFAVGAVLSPEGSTRRLTVDSAAPVAGGPGWWLTFHEVKSRTAAESLREAFLEVEVDREVDLDPDAAYWHEVVGVEVRARDGAVLGRVADVYRAGAAEVYTVRGGPPGEFDLPAVSGIIVEFTPRAGVIVVDESVLDLDSAPVDVRPPAARKPHRWSRHGKGGAAATPATDEP